MAYRMIEELNNRGNEKVAVFLTMRNIIGIIFLAVPAYLISIPFPILIRAIIIVIGAGVGFALTTELNGMPVYEHGVWQARGFIRRKLGGSIISPESYVGAVVQQETDRATRIDGPIQPILRTRRPIIVPIASRERPVQAEQVSDASDTVEDQATEPAIVGEE